MNPPGVLANRLPVIGFIVFSIAMLGPSIPAGAQTITFETLPDGTPLSGGTIISNQFSVAPYGVTFRFEDGTHPVIRRVGGNLNGKPTAFWGYPNDSGYNTPAPAQNVGTYFLSDNGRIDEAPAPFIVSYSSPVASASGFILDVDHYEAWDIYARDSQSNVVASLHLEHHTAGTGDGIATPFSFQRPVADISSIRIVFTGNTNLQNNGIGLAFDNFSPSSKLATPAPATLELDLQSTVFDLTVFGTPEAVYSIEAATTPSGPGANWNHLTSVVLPGPSLTLSNFSATSVTQQRFFRAVGLQ